MSIKKLAQKYMESTEEESYSIIIGARNIELFYPPHKITLKRWSDTKDGIILYSAFFSSVYRWNEEEVAVLKRGISHIINFLDEYNIIKKEAGWAIVHELNTPDISDKYYTLMAEFNDHSVTDLAQAYIPSNFDGARYILSVLAAKLPESLSRKINTSYESVLAIAKGLSKTPLCIPKQNVSDLMNYKVRFEYHGTEFTISRDDTKYCYHVCYSNDTMESFPYPLTEDNFMDILESVENQNRLKNMVQPNTKFFGKYVNNEVHRTEPALIRREFDSLVDGFEDWVSLETIFKKLYDEEIHPKRMHEFVHTASRKSSKTTIECKYLPFEGITFWFVFKDCGDSSKNDIRIFKTNDTNIPKEANETIMKFLHDSVY